VPLQTDAIKLDENSSKESVKNLPKSSQVAHQSFDDVPEGIE
jgi:hypothetical protein